MVDIQELLEELQIRFNTSPKQYEKKDYWKLIETIKALVDLDEDFDLKIQELKDCVDTLHAFEGGTISLPKKLSLLIDDLGDYPVHTHAQYLTTHQSLDGFASQQWVESKNYLTLHLSLPDYSDVYATKLHNHDGIYLPIGIYLTEHLDISGKQDILIPGDNIQIAEDGKTISAISTVYDDTALAGRVSTIEGKESGWDEKYNKPDNGIPSNDLSSDVLISLEKANSALQSYTETDPTVPAWAKEATKPSYTAFEIGLGNVDNTSDSDKPISTATQTALSSKVDKEEGKGLFSGSYTDLSDTPTIPTKTSDLTNDSEFVTLTELLLALSEYTPNQSKLDTTKLTLLLYGQIAKIHTDLTDRIAELRASVIGLDEFAKLGTGLFIHWGVYAAVAGTYTGTKQPGSKVTTTNMTRNTEWAMRDMAIPIDTYMAYQTQFNTTNWDPENIAKMASDAGMGYIVITAKHHEGFSLYPTNYGYWDVRTAGTTDAPCSLTILDDLKAACDKYHLKFGIYMSQYADWCAEGGFNRTTNGNWNGSSTDLFTEAQHNAYLDRTISQMNEIVEKYEPYIIWWDPVGSFADTYQNKMINAWQNDFPQVITNDRITYNRAYGDYGTGERTIYLGTKKYGESCFTMNNTWGYSENNETDSWYYTHELIFKEFILYTLMYGQNCLMNVGPKADGTIPSRQVDMLTTMKNFTNAYGSFKGYKRVCYNAIPKWGYMVQIGDNTVMCYVITKNNPTTQNVTIDCVDVDNLASVEILTPATGATYSIHDGKIDITNLGLDETTKVGVVKLNYTIAPQMPDANMLSANEKLPAQAFPYTNGNFSYNFGTSGSYGSTKFTADIYYTAKPSSNATMSSAFIWKGDTTTYTISPNLTSDTLDTDTYIVTLKDSAGTTQTINFAGSITNDTDTVSLVNGEKYTVSIKFTGSSTAASIKFYGITFVPYVEIIHPTSVSLDYNTTVVEIDGTAQLTATVLPADANNKSVTWSSANEAIATVEDGLVIGIAAGETTITVTTEDGSKTDSCIVTVTAPVEDIIPVTSIEINPSTKTLTIGETATLTVNTTPVNATYQNVTWTSNDETKVTVADGVITAVGIGSAIVTAKNIYDDTKEATCVVTVEGIPVDSITLNETTLTLIPGYKQTLTATVLPANATDASINWDSSDSNIATVDNNGNIFAKIPGLITITAATNDGRKVATCALTVQTETYDYLFERDNLDGSNGQGEIAKFQDEGSDNYGENILLFSDEMDNWTLFGYVHDCINKYQNGSTTTVETNQTLYQCVVNASPWTGTRVDGNNAVSKVIGVHVPLRFRFMAGSDNYVNATTGEVMANSVQESVTADKHPICFSRNGSTYKFSADGVNWITFEGINSTQIDRLKECILTVGFDYKRSSGTMTTTEYRHLYTDSPCCVSFKAVSEYPFYTLYQKYDKTLNTGE